MKKLNRKGFTLIELLAVIVILAIILVIAVPSVLNIQKTAKQKTTKDEALMLVKSIETCMAAEQNVSSCGAANLANYYEKSDNKATAVAGVTAGSNKFYYTITGSAESYTINDFKFSSNGYVISGISGKTASVKSQIDGSTPTDK